MRRTVLGICLVFVQASSSFADSGEALFDAVAENNLAQVESLLATGVDVNARVDGITALMMVGNVKIAKLLIAAGADVNAIYEDGDGASVLHLIAGNQCDAELVEVLIDAGAEVNAEAPMLPAEVDATPLDVAVFCAMGTGDTSVIEVLLAHGGRGELYQQMMQAELEDQKRDAEREIKTGPTIPLLDAALLGSIAEVAASIAGGADIDEINEYGETALHLAIRTTTEAYGDDDGPAKVKLLIEAGANLEIANRHGYRPIHLIAHAEFMVDGGKALAILQMLIDAGADVNAETPKGSTPLFLASEFSIRELLKANGGKE